MSTVGDGGEITTSETDAVPEAPGGDPPPVAEPGLGFLLARGGGRAIRAFNRALQPFGLRSRHYTVLLVTAEAGGCSQRDLGAALDVDPSVVVSLVDDLEGAGFVRREVRPGDRRTRLVTATPTGLALLARLRVLSDRVDDDLAAGLSPADRAALLSLLRRVALG